MGPEQRARRNDPRVGQSRDDRFPTVRREAALVDRYHPGLKPPFPQGGHETVDGVLMIMRLGHERAARAANLVHRILVAGGTRKEAEQVEVGDPRATGHERFDLESRNNGARGRPGLGRIHRKDHRRFHQHVRRVLMTGDIFDILAGGGHNGVDTLPGKQRVRAGPIK